MESCFMNFEDTSFNLFSEDEQVCYNATVCLKNAVIGSNKQKSSTINSGVVPKLISILRDNELRYELRLNCLIIIGSLAKGSAENVQELCNHGTCDVILDLIFAPTSSQQLVEMCLSVLKTIIKYPTKSVSLDLLHTNINTLSRLIQLASPETSIQCQSYVVNILVSLCISYADQMNVCQAGGIPFLSRLIQMEHIDLQLPALKSLSSMCFTNRAVSDIVCATSIEGISILDYLSTLVSRTKDPCIQLAASRCLTYIHRAGSLKSTDHKILYKTLPCLARLCTAEFHQNIRSEAAESLAYLAEIDSELQRLAAISNHLIASLTDLLLKNCTSKEARQGAFRCFASLAANDEIIRKRIIEMKGLIEEVLNGLKDDCPEVRLAAVRCLHSLSRSVQLLRTTFQDHSVWRPLMDLIDGKPSSELLTVVTSTICNLLLEFSPSKEPMLESGAIEILCELTKSNDAALRLNGSWALMNMAFQAEQHIKTKIIDTLGTDQVFQLLKDSDTRVIMKTLGLLRNLLSSTLHIESLMSIHSEKILCAVNFVLDSQQHNSEVKEQALCIIGNIAACMHEREYVMEDENILIKLKDYLGSNDTKLQTGALFAIRNLMHKESRRAKLHEFGILTKLDELLSNSNSIDSQFGEEFGKIKYTMKYEN